MATVQYCNYDIKGTLAVAGNATFANPVSIVESTSSPLLNIYNTSNGSGATIKFSDISNQTQTGTITYVHTDTQSYGSGNAFVLTGDQATMTILADGKLMYKEGVYLKPASGTGGGTRKDSLWDSAYTKTNAFTTIGTNFTTIPDVSVVSYTRINANETVSLLSASQFLTAIGGAPATGGTYLPIANPTFTGTITGPQANFTSTVTVDNMLTITIDDISTGENRGLRLINENQTDQQWNITAGITGVENESFCVRNSTDNINALTIARNSNATFAGDVTVSGTEYINNIQARTSAGLKLGNDDYSGFIFINNAGPVEVGDLTKTSNTTLSILTAAENNSILKFRESTDNYGFTQQYQGTGNYFELLRHDNSGSGNTVYRVARNSDNITFYGNIILANTGRIQGIDTVSAGTDAANKTYVDTAVSSAGSGTFLPLAGGRITGTAKIEFNNASQYIQAVSNNDLEVVAGDDINYKSNFSRFFSGSVEHARLSGLTNQNNWIALTNTTKLGVGTNSPGGKLDVSYPGTGGTGTFGIGEGLNITALTPNLTFNDTSASVDNYAIHLNQNVFTIGRYTSSTAQNADLVLASGNATFGGDITVSGGDITLGGTGRIQGVDTVSASTDAANKAYVDTQIATIPSGLNFQGNWNASTNSPTLASGTGTPGFYYNVSVAGSTDLDGETDWEIGDWAVFVENGTNDFWEKIDNTSALTGVGANNQVSLWGGTNTLEGSTALTFTGGNLNVTGDGNSAQWFEAYNNQVTAISDSGSSTTTLTLTQEDGGTLTTSFSNPQGNVTTGGFTSARVPFANSSTNLDNSANLTFDGTNLTVGGLSLSKIYKTTAATISNSYVRIMEVDETGSQLSSVCRVTMTAHGNSHVTTATAYIYVGHFQDILIESVSLNYTQVTLKVESNSNGQWTLSVKSTSSNAASYKFDIEGLTNNLTITLLPTSSQTGTTLEHTTNFGTNITSIDGSTSGSLKSRFGGNVFLDNVDTNNSNTSGLFINTSSKEIEKRTLGTGAFTDINLYLLLTGGTVSGQINGITPTAAANLTRKDYVDTAVAGAGSGTFLPLAGGTMATGAIITGTDTLNIRTDTQLLIRASDNSSIASFKYINANYNVLEIFDDNRLRFQDGMELYLDESGIIDYMMFTTETTGAGNHAMHRFAGYEFQGTGLATIMKMGGAVNATNIELYQNGTKRLETTSTGVTITGGLTTTGNININNPAVDKKISFNRTGGKTMSIEHDASSIYFYNATDAVTMFKMFNAGSATVTGDFTVNGGDITLGGTGRIQGVDTVSAGTDAANKDYVDTAVAGSGSGTVTSVSSSTTSQLTVSQSSPAPALSIVTGAVTNGGTALATGDQIYDATTTRLGSYLPLEGGTMTGTTKHGDNITSYWGTGDDLEIFHNSSGDSVIQNHVGDLYFNQKADDSDIIFRSDDGSGNLAIYFNVDGSAVETRFSKTTRHFDNVRARFGDSADLEIYHDGLDSFIKDSGTGNLTLISSKTRIQNAAGNANCADFIDGGAVELYYNGGLRFKTETYGASVYNTAGASSQAVLRVGGSEGNQGSTLELAETLSSNVMNYGFSFVNDGNNSNTLLIKRHNNSSTGNTVISISRGSDHVNFEGDIVLSASSSIVLDDTPTASTASGSGTIVNWSVSTSVSAGTLYVIKSDGGWTTADADSEAKSTAMAAIALGSNATAGMLLQGFFYKSNHGFAIGSPLYISNTAGAFSNSRPTGTGDYVRIIGYATSTNYIYFDPDKTWVKID